MDDDYPWNADSYGMERSDGFSRSLLVAVVLALLIHVGFFFWMSRTMVDLEITETTEWESEPLRLAAVETQPEVINEAPPEEEIERPEDDGQLISEVEEVTPDFVEVDLEVTSLMEESLPELPIEKPALDGVDDGELLRPTIGPSVATEIPEPGQLDNLFPEAKTGQVIVDKGKPLRDVFDPESLADELGRKKGSRGLNEKGVIKGYTGLAEYARMSPGDLQQNKASIGSDLLFEFNSASLRENARMTLMTVAMLIERNPDMYCWVEGHTDLIGGDRSNRELSRRRGEAVKQWLVQALKIPPQRIIVRAFGKDQPVVVGGTIEEQAPNRRVDIKMRKVRPEPMVPKARPPGKAVVVEDEIPRAEVIQPRGPVPPPPEEEEIPRALPVEEGIPE